jgi:hypothetical protein
MNRIKVSPALVGLALRCEPSCLRPCGAQRSACPTGDATARPAPLTGASPWAGRTSNDLMRVGTMSSKSSAFTRSGRITPHPDRLKAELWQERFTGTFDLQAVDTHRGHELDRVWNAAFMRQQRSATKRAGILHCRHGRSGCCRMNAAFRAPAASPRCMEGFDLQNVDAHQGHELDASVWCPPFRVFSASPDTLKGGHRTKRFTETASGSKASP